MARVLGEQDAAWLLQEAVAALDMEHAGLLCRRLAFAPSQARRALRVFEDVRHLLGWEGRPAKSRIQVWAAPAPGAFRFSAEGVVADLLSVRPDWELRFRLLPAGAPPPRRTPCLARVPVPV